MKEITIPDTVTVDVPLNREGTEVATVEFPFVKYLEEQVFTKPEWRDGSLDKFNAWIDCCESFNNRSVGDKVVLEDASYEIFKPMALQQGVQIAPHIAKSLGPYFKAVFSAKKVSKSQE